MVKIILPEDYSISIPTQNVLLIRRNSKYALINLYDLSIIQNTLDRKTILEIILRELSWIPTPNSNPITLPKKRKRSRKTTTIATTEQKVTMLKFIKNIQPQTQQSHT